MWLRQWNQGNVGDRRCPFARWMCGQWLLGVISICDTRTMVKEMTGGTIIQAQAISLSILSFDISQWKKSSLINFHWDWSICQSSGAWRRWREWYLGLYYRCMSWKWLNTPSSAIFPEKIEKTILTMDCCEIPWDNEVGSGKFKRRFLTLLWRPHRKWSLNLDHPNWRRMLVVGVLKHRQKLHVNLVRVNKALWGLYISSLSKRGLQ